MTMPTDELSRLLTGAADDILEREHVPGPDGLELWRLGRRVTWAGRAAAAGIVLVVALLVVTGGLLVSGLPATAPANGGTLTYPEVVSDMFTHVRRTDDAPLFGLVATLTSGSQPSDSLVIERQGSLTSLGTGPARGDHIVLSNNGTAPPLAPDGKRVLTDLGNTDPADGPTVGIVDYQRCGDPTHQHRPRDPSAHQYTGRVGTGLPTRPRAHRVRARRPRRLRRGGASPCPG